jgi:SAM-dependent methyltransferase
MLTVAFDRLGVTIGSRVLDVGCGGGRHAFEAWRRGATVVALDAAAGDLADVAAIARAMADAGELAGSAPGGPVNADALCLPFADATFDCVIASEVLEHVWRDSVALRELTRVTKPGGRIAVTVPARWPERVCWALDARYHDRPGGHVRVYDRRGLEHKLREAGCQVVGAGRAHALHSPYWWLRCAAGVDREPGRVARWYHDLLSWQITTRPRWLDSIERALDPVLGKSLVLYARKPATPGPR